ncbi:MAG: hypothetical protein GX410_02750, partial [Elusimicrobia bacterium]|nr:hypothetical protein [Elusimicrobiota bacterium]
MKELDNINSPADLKKLPVQRLAQVAGEVRDTIVSTISKNGGHLGS